MFIFYNSCPILDKWCPIFSKWSIYICGDDSQLYCAVVILCLYNLICKNKNIMFDICFVFLHIILLVIMIFDFKRQTCEVALPIYPCNTLPLCGALNFKHPNYILVQIKHPRMLSCWQRLFLLSEWLSRIRSWCKLVFQFISQGLFTPKQALTFFEQTVGFWQRTAQNFSQNKYMSTAQQVMCID